MKGVPFFNERYIKGVPFLPKWYKKGVRSTLLSTPPPGALIFNILDFDQKRISQDNKHIKIIKKLQATTVNLKPDKGEGEVLNQ